MMAGGSEALFTQLSPLLDDITGTSPTWGHRAGPDRKDHQSGYRRQHLSADGGSAGDGTGRRDRRRASPSALKGGAADSTILQTIYKQMVAADFEPPRSRAKQLNKDMHSVAEFSAQHGLTLPLQDATVRQFQAYVDQGGGESDSASISLLYV